ncbi:hypothetical protein JOD64_000705 [Micromonospora luteifusca]|uniref:LysM domain-containing protein n=1 Tax=Micromonospora luteifusca TaxID=709860 RepID=A0ABS2LMT2_9ACTN|nr:hypothetical protein [Micromonospora luteifusca]MBM7489483.1 hypothetical protein [Micromonospora luteifusca]
MLARLALVLAAVAGAVLGALSGPTAAPGAPATPAETGKYYVVGQPVNGQREHLYAIALKTLGNGNRYHEIADLNRGRRQPDDDVLTDALTVKPGWILVLPAGAKGPGVRTGPIPAVVPGAPSTEGSSAPPPRAAAHEDREIDGTLLRIGGFAITLLLVILALRVLHGGSRRTARAATGPASGPEPAVAAGPTIDPIGPRKVTDPGAAIDPGDPPEPASRPAAPGVPSVSASAATLPTTEPDPNAGTRTPGTQTAKARTPGPRTPEAGRSETPPRPVPSASGGGRPVVDVPLPEDATVEAGAPRATDPVAATTSAGAADAGRPVEPRPALPGADDQTPDVSEKLLTEDGPVSVRLSGVTPGEGRPAYAWLAEGEEPPPAIVPLVLGHRDGWRLHVDLARTPDVLTIVGPDDDCRRRAAAYARQLRGAGLGVAIVGDALGHEAVPGTRRLERFPELPAADEPRPEPYVVLCAGLPEPAAIVRQLARATQGRAVPVILGSVPAGRWSIRLDVAD